MIGQTLSKYRILEKLGQGGMGVVYKAEDTRLQRHVAIKLIAPELTRDAPARSRFLQEARAMSSFEHPNICVVHEVDETEDGRMFMAMTYYAGQTLREMIAQGPLEAGRAADIAAQVARGLAGAHEQGVVHRDIKPANILVPERGPVKILDFGIAKLLNATRLTQEGRTIGTVGYMSPEQVAGDPVDHRTDLWSLGVVLFEMLTGRLPFPADHPQAALYLILNSPPRLDELRQRASPALVEIVRRCLEKKPERRHAGAAELADELDRLRALPATGTLPLRPPGTVTEDAVSIAWPTTISTLREVAPSVMGKVPFVGREGELGRLQGMLREALAGGGRVVFIPGEPGMGKTALITELARRACAGHPGLVSVAGKCNAQTGIGDPYLPFREILGLLVSDADRDWTLEGGPCLRGEATLRPAIRALLDSGPDLLGTFLPAQALASRASLAGEDPDTSARLERLLERREAAPMPPQQSDLFDQYTRVLQSLSWERPLLLVLEDLHWADAGSISLLFHLSRRLQGSRVLVVGTYRPAEVALGTGGDRHPLAPVLNELRRELPDLEIDLNAASGEDFLAALFDLEPNRLDDRFRRSLFRQTRGNPLFTIELLHGMRERGLLGRDTQGQWQQQSDIAWEELPARVEAVAAERLDRLPEHLHRILTTASIEGEDFTAEAVARLQGTSEREMVQVLSGELDRRHHLVSALGVQRVGDRRLSRYRFAHIVFQKYLYHRLDEVERSYLHEEMGLALESLYGDRAGEIAGTLGRHFAEAGAVRKAVDYLARAGQAASRLSAHPEALGHYEEALRLLRTEPAGPERDRMELGLLTQLAPLVASSRGYASAQTEEICDRALQLCQQLGEGQEFGWVLFGIWSFRFVSGQFEAARQQSLRLIELGESQEDPTHLIQGHYTLAVVLQYLGDFPGSARHGELSWSLYEAHGSPQSAAYTGQDVGVMTQNALCWTYWALGQPERALACRDRALALAREIGHPWSLSMALYYSIWLRQFLREAPQVEEEARNLEDSSEGQSGYLVTLAVMERGWALGMSAADAATPEEREDRLERGLEMIRRTYRENAATGARVSQAYYLSLLIDVCLRHGRLDEAREALATATSILDATGERFWLAEIQRQQGELAWQSGDEAAAETWFRQSLETARAQSALSYELRAAMALAGLWAGQGRAGEGRALVAEVYGKFTEGFETVEMRGARELMTELSPADA